MGRRKYPDQTKSMINFETGSTDEVPELKEEREARLRKERDARTKAVKAGFRAVAPRERRDARNKAFRLSYAGKPFPIHYDVVFEQGTVETTERFTLEDAGFSNRADKRGLVGHPSATKCRPSRTNDIPPDFVHRVRLKSD